MLNILWERSDFFWRLTLEHLAISAFAIFASALIGITLGLWIAEKPKLAPFVLQSNNIIYTIPSISMFGLLLPFSGIGNLTAVIALTLYGLLPMIGATNTGIRQINPAIIEAADAMGSSRWQLLYKIKLPLALPSILTAFRTMVVMIISLAGVASFIGAGGLGVAIYRGITTNNTALSVAGSLLIMLLAFSADSLCAYLAKKSHWEK
ncbi:osmoprotectant transport system permease protein [Pasteurella testudinis DSM 23072]|uniref:Osmoprotectant transport system permease protein n=1 Tax=Pasteurella testudinis DSM 23072 TaxID=1122938 RepID=A0A1W1V8L9_9PAST|nr:ABC transporter permease [Pasteurella testudinis]SMB89779.1 osmoprotectant transport system permease protein [Pasteurella testudinis DSM 23072]SUB52084.1 Putative osmoprotectant uptake system permease protein yehY [Pasteurella testudinis]